MVVLITPKFQLMPSDPRHIFLESKNNLVGGNVIAVIVLIHKVVVICKFQGRWAF